MMLFWIVVGFVVGSVVKLLMLGKDLGGCIVMVLFGVVGVVVGGLIGMYLGWGFFQGFDLCSMGFVVGGLCLFLVFYCLVFGGGKELKKLKKKDQVVLEQCWSGGVFVIESVFVMQCLVDVGLCFLFEID